MSTPLVFVSHSASDRQRVERLVRELIRNRINVWYDQWEILVGHDIVDKVYAGIRKSDFLAIVLTESSTRSQWVSEELHVAKVLEIESRRTIILPLLFDNVSVPDSLRTKRYADFTASFELGLVELLRALGVPGDSDDMLMTLHQALDGSDDKTAMRWDKILDGSAAVLSWPDLPNSTSPDLPRTLHTWRAHLLNSLRLTYEAIAQKPSSANITSNERALLRDWLRLLCFTTAADILQSQAASNLEATERAAGFLKEYRMKLLNEVGPHLRDLSARNGRAVIESALEALRLTMAELREGRPSQ